MLRIGEFSTRSQTSIKTLRYYDAIADVSARLADGERVSPDEYYLRTVPAFETSAPQYWWLNNVVAVAVGQRLPDGVIYDVFEVL